MPTFRTFQPFLSSFASSVVALSLAGVAACDAPASPPPDGADGDASAIDERGALASRSGGGCLPFIDYDTVNDPPGGAFVSPPVSAKVAFTLEDEFGTVCGAPGSICTRIVSISIGSDGAWLIDSPVRGYVPPPFPGVGYSGNFYFDITVPAQAHAIRDLLGAPCPEWTPFDNSMVGGAQLSLSFNGDTGRVTFEQECVWDHWDFITIPPEPFGPEDGFLYASSRHHVKGEGQILCPIAP